MRDYRDPAQMEELLQELFGLDLILPEQFYQGRSNHTSVSGERALMWAVLADGIECFQRTAHGTRPEDVEEFAETKEWILTTDWDSAFSFANLCEMFGFAPEALRKALLDWTESSKNGRPRQRFRPAALRAA